MKYSYASVALAALLSACGGGSGSAGNSTAAEVPATAPTAVGHAAKAEGIDLTITDVATPKQLGPQGVGGKAEKGETYVVVSYTIRNTASKTLPFQEWPAFSLVDGGGHSYPSDAMASAMSASTMTDPSGMMSDLNPSVSAKAKAAWKVDAKTFDRGTWRLVVASDPQLTFALK